MATFGSLFAGVGGFDIGFEAAGWKCEFQVEWDKHCQQTLQHHWPDVPKWWDVSDVKGTELPPVDLITFGSPCQDLSVAGNRAGLQLEGGRSNLFYEATRIIKEMRDGTGNNFPRWAIWENVPGAFSSNKGADFGSVLDEMANIGAVAVEWNCLDAQFFGVPQRRRRVFVIACFDPAIANRGGQKILPVSEGRRRNTSTRKPKGQSVAGETPTSVGTDSQPIIFSHTQGLDAQPSETASPTLRVGGAGMAVAEPFTPSSHAGYTDGVGTLRANGGDLGGGSETLLVHSKPGTIKVLETNT